MSVNLKTVEAEMHCLCTIKKNLTDVVHSLCTTFIFRQLSMIYNGSEHI